MRKKELLAHLIGNSTVSKLLIKCRQLLKKELIVLAYHRVTDHDLNTYQYYDGLISATTEEFDFQIAYIKKHFTPISMDQVINHVEHDHPLPPKAILVTFDDGFDDNYHNAFPILKKHNVPATIFVSTELISTTQSIWFDQLAALIRNTNQQKIEIQELGQIFHLNSNKENRSDSQNEIFAVLKSTEGKLMKAILARLFKEFSNELSLLPSEKSRMLTWEQIQEMSKFDIQFGSHTVSHPILSQLSLEDLQFELKESRTILEKMVGKVVKSISYPNGGRNDYNDQVLSETKDSGYTVGFTYVSNNNQLPIVKPFELDRIHVEHYVNRNYFRCLLYWPELFSE